MTCSQCHKNFDDDAKFCPHCGQEQLFNQFPNESPNSSAIKKKTAIKICIVVAIGILTLIIQSSHWHNIAFGERHTVSGIATNFVQIGNGIKENTYQILASIDGGEEQYIVVQAMVSLDYYFQATCVEAGTVNLVSAIGSAEYPFYIQVSE